MFNSTILETAIGMVFLYLLLSLFSSVIMEWMAGIFALRAKTLAEGIRNLLGDTEPYNLTRAFYAHGLIKGLSKPWHWWNSLPFFKPDWIGKDGPSEIPANTFAVVLLDILGVLSPLDIRKINNPTPDAIVQQMIQNAEGKPTLSLGTIYNAHIDPTAGGYANRHDTPSYGKREKLRLSGSSSALAKVKTRSSAGEQETGTGERGRARLGDLTLSREFRQILRVFVAQSNGSIPALQSSLEVWYNVGNVRISGWYKRKTQVYLFGIGLVVAVATNADTLRMRRALEDNHTMRAAIVAAAQRVSSQPDPANNANGQPAGGSSAAGLAGGKAGTNPSSDALVKIKPEDLTRIPLPIGWSPADADNFNRLFHFSLNWQDFSSVKFMKCLYKLGGCLLTTLAISLGAPFWFDTLKRIMNVRASGKTGTPLPSPGKQDSPPALK